MESGTLNFTYNVTSDTNIVTSHTADLSTNSKSNINLVIGEYKNNNGLDMILDDDGASYECELNTSTRTIKNILDGYQVSGRVYFVVDEDNSDLIDTLWIFVDEIQ